MTTKWDCNAVIIVGSRAGKIALKKICGESRTTPLTVGGQSYEMMQSDSIGLCFCGVSSSTQPKTRIAKLAKLDKYFDYEQVIVVNPPYSESDAKRARVGVKPSWYFVDDKQALIDILKIKYDGLSEAERNKMDKLLLKLIPPPPPQRVAPPNIAPAPGQIIAQDGSSVIVMRGAPPHPNHFGIGGPSQEFMLALLGAASARGSQAPRRKASESQREAQPEAKKAKAVSKEDMECLCCADNQKSVRLHPCGHWEMCGVCAAKVEVCPSCSKPIEDRQHIWV